MTIEGTNIWTWKFFLVTVTGLFNQPARKKILDEPGTEAKDIKHVNKDVTVEIAANFDDTATLKANVASLLAALGSGEKTFSFVSYGKTITGYVKDGVNIEIIKSSIVKAKFKIEVTG